MLRRIIIINEEKCDGCGLCVEACHEGAIGLKNGKAVLLRDDYCDGLGDCLPACPAGAISFAMRDTLPYDEAAVQANLAGKGSTAKAPGCPGSRAGLLGGKELAQPEDCGASIPSCLRQWPVQLALAPAKAAFFSGADLLIAADCAAYAHGNFHAEFMRGKVTLIGCPKLDAADYTEKLTEILCGNDIKSLTVARITVPCCGGIEQAAEAAVRASGKDIPLQVLSVTPEGEVSRA